MGNKSDVNRSNGSDGQQERKQKCQRRPGENAALSATGAVVAMERKPQWATGAMAATERMPQWATGATAATGQDQGRRRATGAMGKKSNRTNGSDGREERWATTAKAAMSVTGAMAATE